MDHDKGSKIQTYLNLSFNRLIRLIDINNTQLCTLMRHRGQTTGEI